MIKLELPNSLDGLTLRQAHDLINLLAQNKDYDLQFMCELVSIFSGQTIETLRRVDKDALMKAYTHCVGISKRENKPPQKEITINGKTYTFHDLSHKQWTTGRYIDSSNKSISIDDRPEVMIAISYIEKDSEYGDHPLDERAEIMKEHFKGSHYLDWYAFFLQKFEQLKPGYLVLQIAKAQHESQKALKIMRENG